MRISGKGVTTSSKKLRISGERENIFSKWCEFLVKD